MEKRKKRARILKKTARDIMSNLPLRSDLAIKDAVAYSLMSKSDLEKLEAFDANGNVKFYEIGGVLLGKSALLKFIETLKNK
jgi:hypothetical protein